LSEQDILDAVEWSRTQATLWTSMFLSLTNV
jgi:hypothetical protein